MRLLVKLGGTLLDSRESLHRLAGEIAEVSRRHQLVVVHGGGKQMTRFLEKQGVESQFINGLRVSGPEVIEAVLSVFAGTVNHQLVAALRSAGTLPLGLTGIDAGLTECDVLDPQLGFVGRIVKVRADVLVALTSSGYLPVVACVGGDSNGAVYNVNADLMAVALATGFRAEQLWFLTDVEGVRGADGQKLASLMPSDCIQLIASGIATGGMQAKLNAATSAIAGGVQNVVIAPGAQPGIVSRLEQGGEAGTRLLPEGGVVRHA